MASSAAPATSFPPWSDLPEDLLIKVASLLTFFVDLFRFRSVCRSWRSTALAAAAGNRLPRRPSPFLMSQDEADPLTRRFYSVRDGKVRRLRFPEGSAGWRYCGSSRGWLLMLDPRAGVRLFNPFSGACIELPPLTTLPGVHGGGGADGLAVDLEMPLGPGGPVLQTVGVEFLGDVYVEKAVVALDPASDTGSSAVVVLLLHGHAGLVYARPGDEAWTVLPAIQARFLDDVVHHDGRLYGPCLEFHILVTVDLFTGASPRTEAAIKPTHFFGGKGYLVVLPCGAILQVRRDMNTEPDPVKTESIQVFGLNPEIQNVEHGWKKWVKVKELPGISLFVDRNCSMALYSSEVSGECRGNCVYFAYDARQPRNLRKKVIDDHDYGLFRLEDESFEWGFASADRSEMKVKHPVWVMLSM